MRTKKELGRWGEQLAEEYLRKKGYTILRRNFQIRQGEIDIICVEQEILVFVEVKTRTGTAYGYPQEAVNYTKMQHMRTAALAFLNENKDIHYKALRFDVIGIIINGSNELPQIEHIENVFV